MFGHAAFEFEAASEYFIICRQIIFCDTQCSKTHGIIWKCGGVIRLVIIIIIDRYDVKFMKMCFTRNVWKSIDNKNNKSQIIKYLHFYYANCVF